MSELIRIKNLTKKYRIGSEIIHALDNVNLTIAKGEFLCILGTSGSGKTTLLNLTAGLEKPTKGEIYIQKVLLNKVKEQQMSAFRRKHMGYVFQSFNLVPSLTALENVALPLTFDGVPAREREARAKKLLTDLGLKDRLNNKPSEMSGGQQQRVSIARALINNPKIIFADEPTGNLDTKTTQDIMDLLSTTIKTNNQTLIMVTHDRELTRFADRIVEMVDGQIVKITTKGGGVA